MGSQESWQDLVRAFNAKFSRPSRDEPTTDVDAADVESMRRLLTEEFGELERAMDAANLTKIADGVGDVIYVVLGIALLYGVDADRAVRAVHESNLTRQAPRSGELQSDKVPRGEDYVPPDIDGVIGTAEN